MALMTLLSQKLLLQEAYDVGEHWIDDHGQAVEASGEGEYNHEGYVTSILIPILADACDFPDGQDYGPDYIWFRTDLLDWMDAEGIDADEAIDEAWRTIAQTHGESFARDMQACLTHGAGGAADARAFAIKHWGWIRVAGYSLELRDFTPQMLKRAGNGYTNLFFEQEDQDPSPDLQVDVSIYGRSKRLTVLLSDLLEGRLTGENDAHHDLINHRAKMAVAAMDRQLLHPTYRGFGD